MNNESRDKWNNIYQDVSITATSPTAVLKDNKYLLPKVGKALDIACGAGANAIFLARNGLEVEAIDVSDKVIDKLNEYANVQDLSINARVMDVMQSFPSDALFDVVVVAHFLERELAEPIINCLKPGGLLFYQTFSQEVTEFYTGPRNPAFRLACNELLSLFSPLKIVVFREEGLIGDLSKGFRNEAQLIAIKR